ncbi:MAG: flagellar protein FlgN [Syntrophaceae bacterium]|nr:flagellar protein FlgN [Syntrophaceae bacterium]
MNQKTGSCINNGINEELALLYERLLANLDRELSVQKSLLSLLEEEQKALTQASLETIQEANTRKEALILKGKENSALRQEIIEQVCALPGWGGAKVTLSFFTEKASDPHTASQLRQRQEALNDITKAVRIQNERNMKLIDAAMRDVQGAIQLIQNMVSSGGNYQKSGQFSRDSIQGSLINREG